MPDKLTPEQRKKCMKSIRSNDSKIEIRLRKALWHKGYRYRKNYKELPGKPDIAITKYKIAVFCDSEFFHGKDWDKSLHAQIMRGNNAKYWEKKILRNMERDATVEHELKGLGWKVLRFWGKEIDNNLDGCLRVLEEAIFDSQITKGE